MNFVFLTRLSGYWFNVKIMYKKLLMLLLLCSFAGTLVAQTREEEYTIKAAFIYNFTKYIEWETSSNQNEFVIGIVGSSGINMPLVLIARTNTVKNKKIMVRIVNNLEDIRGCSILFISKNNTFSLPSILDQAGRGVLTVSEEPGFAKLGTAFNFVIKNDKIKFEANLRALNSAGLRASSQLLKLAQIVGG